MKIAGLDIGTTGCKVTVFEQDGRFLGKEYADYPSTRGEAAHEMNADNLMKAVWTVLERIADRFPDIAGIGVTSFGETFVMTDRQGKPLLPAMLYTDPRGQEECVQLSKRLGDQTIADITGLRCHETYSLPKLMWVKKHCPQLYADAAYVFLIEDYVIFHLTGERVIDYSLATRTMGFDIRKLCWSSKMFEAAEIDMRLMSRTVPTGSVAGTLTKEAAAVTGLAEDVKIVAVSHDQVAACVGAGAFDASLAVDGAGTVECLTPVYDRMPDMEQMYQGYFSVIPYVVPGTFVAYAFSYTGGALIQWCTDHLAKAEKEEARKQGVSVNEYLEKRYLDRHGSDPSGLLVLPHFAGAATPYMDSGSRGAMIGLTADTDVSDLYRACMEGVVYEMYLNLQAIQKTGIRFNRLHATGGGARSSVWMQMKADILNLPITALETADAGTVGSAMLTGIAIGVFQDLREAGSCMVAPRETYVPDPVMHEKYMAVYERYEKLYAAVRPLCC